MSWLRSNRPQSGEGWHGKNRTGPEVHDEILLRFSRGQQLPRIPGPNADFEARTVLQSETSPSRQASGLGFEK